MLSPENLLTIIGIVVTVIGALVAIYVKLIVTINTVKVRQDAHEHRCESDKEKLDDRFKSFEDKLDALIGKLL